MPAVARDETAGAPASYTRRNRASAKGKGMKRRAVVALTGLSVALSLAFAAPAQAPSATPASPPVVLKAAHLFDGRSGRLVSPGVVVVQGTRIAAVGASAVPPGANVIDLGNATLLPGFIDAH